MRNERVNIDDELLASYMSGEVDANDRKTVEQWIDQSDTNRQYFEKLKTLWEYAGPDISPREADVDVDRAWSKLKQQIDQQQEDQLKPEGRQLYFYLSRVAALLVLGLVVFLVYQSLVKSPVASEMVIASKEMVKSDTLPDGSQVSLNVNSTVTFNENFSKSERLVTLKGEAFFDVVKDNMRPFIIDTDGTTVKVLGTSFYVRNYDSLGIIEVGVEEGIVQVTSHGKETILQAGEYISVSKNKREFSGMQRYNPNDIFWMSKTIAFEKQSLEAVFSTLERAYQISIDVENPEILNCRLTGKFYKEPVEHVFEIIDANFGFTTIQEEGRFVVSGHGCD
ncbi:FecR domain-containing protein [Fulvivirga ulvae]|uniref:FecR family protein n=1 Tax=Fulvivirga ulvae TaxID=2904245 RepID=UPI001F1D4A63|nr:FecR domain-containing protein [Fulvivirga ulvae]UII32740.1 FecR domain-containing protein [Fulvivirga ulvae]